MAEKIRTLITAIDESAKEIKQKAIRASHRYQSGNILGDINITTDVSPTIQELEYLEKEADVEITSVRERYPEGVVIRARYQPKKPLMNSLLN